MERKIKAFEVFGLMIPYLVQIQLIFCLATTYFIATFKSLNPGILPRIQTVDKALLLQGFAIVGTAFLI